MSTRTSSVRGKNSYFLYCVLPEIMSRLVYICCFYEDMGLTWQIKFFIYIITFCPHAPTQISE